MLLVIAAILALLWLIGFSVHIAGGFIHLLLVVALLVFIYHMVVSRREV